MAMVYFHADAPADAQPEFALPASVRNQVCRLVVAGYEGQVAWLCFTPPFPDPSGVCGGLEPLQAHRPGPAPTVAY